jgi:hypothetical protein
MPVIPVTQEAKIRSYPGQKVSKTSSQQTNQAWWYIPMNPSYQGSTGRRILIQGQ